MTRNLILVDVDEDYDEARGVVNAPRGFQPTCACGWIGTVQRIDPAGESMEARVYAEEQFDAHKCDPDGDEAIPPHGRCDTCGARCDGNGCTVNREHVAALDITDPRP